jgi:hypothetical protein
MKRLMTLFTILLVPNLISAISIDDPFIKNLIETKKTEFEDAFMDEDKINLLLASDNPKDLYKIVKDRTKFIFLYAIKILTDAVIYYKGDGKDYKEICHKEIETGESILEPLLPYMLNVNLMTSNEFFTQDSQHADLYECLIHILLMIFEARDLNEVAQNVQKTIYEPLYNAGMKFFQLPIETIFKEYSEKSYLGPRFHPDGNRSDDWLCYNQSYDLYTPSKSQDQCASVMYMISFTCFLLKFLGFDVYNLEQTIDKAGQTVGTYIESYNKVNEFCYKNVNDILNENDGQCYSEIDNAIEDFGIKGYNYLAKKLTEKKIEIEKYEEYKNEICKNRDLPIQPEDNSNEKPIEKITPSESIRRSKSMSDLNSSFKQSNKIKNLNKSDPIEEKEEEEEEEKEEEGGEEEEEENNTCFNCNLL